MCEEHPFAGQNTQQLLSGIQTRDNRISSYLIFETDTLSHSATIAGCRSGWMWVFVVLLIILKTTSQPGKNYPYRKNYFGRPLSFKISEHFSVQQNGKENHQLLGNLIFIRYNCDNDTGEINKNGTF